MTALRRAGAAIVAHQRGLLVALLTVLHLTLATSDAEPRLRLTLWLIDVGLFMLWQPFVQSDRRFEGSALVGLIGLVAMGVWGFSPVLLLLWTTLLAALVGGRVLYVERRAARVPYLIAFAYLLSAILFFQLPRLVPASGGAEWLLARGFVWGSPLLLLLMAVIPGRGEGSRRSVEPVDFVYALFVLLLMAVLALGSLAYMTLRQTSYVEALFGTVLMMAGMLLVLGWSWDPRPGFGGIGLFFSRYLLTIGLPMEQWLHRLTMLAAAEREPAVFVESALRQMCELPGVEGGSWMSVSGAGSVGGPGRYAHVIELPTLTLKLHTRYRLSPALAWHFRLLAELVAEFHLAKQRAVDLEQVGYLRAIYETGARLTHDIKNLLQSLNNLCYVVQSMDAGRGAEIHALMQRQLPVITRRLEQALEKLRRPGEGDETTVDASIWWKSLQQRHEREGVRFVADGEVPMSTLPVGLFDSVADNLIQNALEKRGHEPATDIVVTYCGKDKVLVVADNGSAIPPEVALALFAGPVRSENGLGVGLYHTALQAGRYGYDLALVANRSGEVRFRLAPVH